MHLKSINLQDFQKHVDTITSTLEKRYWVKKLLFFVFVPKTAIYNPSSSGWWESLVIFIFSERD